MEVTVIRKDWVAVGSTCIVVAVLLATGSCDRATSVPTATTQSKTKDASAELIKAIENDDRATVNRLLESGQVIDFPEALSQAAFYGRVEITASLLDHGGDAKARDADGDTFVAIAAWKNHPAVIELLVQRGASLEAPDLADWSPLSWAASENSLDAVKTLLKLGAKANGGNPAEAMKPLHNAAMGGNAEIAKLLIAAGADINAPSKGGMTPIQIAANMKRWSTVITLAEAGANVNVVDAPTGASVLHWAALDHQVETVRALVEHGAKKAEKTVGGRTPLDEVMRKNPDDPKVAEIKKILQGN